MCYAKSFRVTDASRNIYIATVQIHIAFTLIFLNYKWNKLWIIYDKKSYKWKWNVFPLDIKNFTVFDHRYTWGREKPVETVSCSWELRTLTLWRPSSNHSGTESHAVCCGSKRPEACEHIIIIIIIIAESDDCHSISWLTFLCGECGTVLCPVLESLSSMNISVWPFWEDQTLEIPFAILYILLPT